MTVEPSVSRPFLEGYRNFLAVHWRRNLCPYTAIFYQMSCCTNAGRGSYLASRRRLHPFQDQSACSRLVFEDWMLAFQSLLSPKQLVAYLQFASPEFSWLPSLFSSIGLCLPFLQILLL
jgi:hypothetical protein